MRVQDFRDQTNDLFRLVDDWSACVDDGERYCWRVRAAAALEGVVMVPWSRAVDRDQEMRALARQQLTALLTAPAVATRASTAPSLEPPRSAPVSRAAQYNKSPSRAVRLARAARSAKRRGYF